MIISEDSALSYQNNYSVYFLGTCIIFGLERHPLVYHYLSMGSILSSAPAQTMIVYLMQNDVFKDYVGGV